MKLRHIIHWVPILGWVTVLIWEPKEVSWANWWMLWQMFAPAALILVAAAHS